MNEPAQQSRRLSVQVTGRVQGVGFRHFTRTQANRLGLSGWVRNERNGSVRLEAEGPEEDLQTLLEALRQGPAAARVRDVQADWGEAKGVFGGFEVRF
ncbi:MAG TPA: acylphosphatase [Rhodothermales bacterium]|nr:acylphosphatase [Rhodothermales bacterium]